MAAQWRKSNPKLDGGESAGSNERSGKPQRSRVEFRINGRNPTMPRHKARNERYGRWLKERTDNPAKHEIAHSSSFMSRFLRSIECWMPSRIRTFTKRLPMR